MARIPFITPADVPTGEKAAYEAFVHKRGTHPHAGPYALLFYMPELAQRLESLRLYIRDEASLSQKLQELVMLTVARELLQTRKVSQMTFDRASASFGRRGTLTLTNLVACYATLAYNMNAYELEAPVHATERALPV